MKIYEYNYMNHPARFKTIIQFEGEFKFGLSRMKKWKKKLGIYQEDVVNHS